ncbi:hypothetical protein FGB62_18g21 [Gracilaria domingensis]|nr:hypothetical protein FGB62_18g21 [Gracilaria domingensis]
MSNWPRSRRKRWELSDTRFFNHENLELSVNEDQNALDSFVDDDSVSERPPLQRRRFRWQRDIQRVSNGGVPWRKKAVQPASDRNTVEDESVDNAANFQFFPDEDDVEKMRSSPSFRGTTAGNDDEEEVYNSQLPEMGKDTERDDDDDEAEGDQMHDMGCHRRAMTFH